uniref:Ubiquitin-like protease family profile domain-containing protein n=1 Tax=Aegilops tauschii TaxID=37682 RepID=M8BLK3_AEGTA
MNARLADNEKKVGRKLMEIKHRFDVKYQTLGEDLIDMKTKTGTNPRLSRAEDEIKDLRRELHELKYEFTSNRQSVSQKGGVQDQVNVCNSSLTGTPRASQFTAGTSTTPSARHVTENNEKPQLTPMKPVFGNDYKFTDEDIETAVYIRGTYDPIEIARIGDITLTTEQLKRNLDDKYIYGDVIMAYARISQIENDTTSIISPQETEKLLQMKGVVPVGRAASWSARVAEKFVGRRKVHIPLNVHQNHWMLMMFNFDKKEIQTLNSMNYHCEKTKKDSLVDSIQFCIDEAVKNGLISPAKNINFAEWTKKRYENIPQQTDGTSCAVWTLQYMLSWNGDEMTDIFNQLESYADKEVYDAQQAVLPDGSEDDVQLVNNPDGSNEPDPSNSQKDTGAPNSPKSGAPNSPKRKRACGRPRKLVDPEEAAKTKS